MRRSTRPARSAPPSGSTTNTTGPAAAPAAASPTAIRSTIPAASTTRSSSARGRGTSRSSRPEASEKVMERFEKIVAAFIGPGRRVDSPSVLGPDRFERRIGHGSRAGGSASNPGVLPVPGPQPQSARRRQQLLHRLPPAGADPPIHRADPRAVRQAIRRPRSAKRSPRSSTTSPARWRRHPSPGRSASSDVFRERRGFDLLAKLPALLDDTFPDAGPIRAAYWQTVSERYNECFFDQIQQWCREHGLTLTGHCYEENIAFYANSPQLMEHLRRVDWPGFDALGTRARPAAVKIPVSVTHLEDREEVICEALGLAGGWNCTLDMLRGGYNQLACLGATTFIPHAFFQTVENPRVECPPSFFYQNPYWKYYGRLSGLTDRLSLFNRIGRHVAPVAGVLSHRVALDGLHRRQGPEDLPLAAHDPRQQRGQGHHRRLQRTRRRALQQPLGLRHRRRQGPGERADRADRPRPLHRGRPGDLSGPRVPAGAGDCSVRSADGDRIRQGRRHSPLDRPAAGDLLAHRRHRSTGEHQNDALLRPSAGSSGEPAPHGQTRRRNRIRRRQGPARQPSPNGIERPVPVLQRLGSSPGLPTGSVAVTRRCTHVASAGDRDRRHHTRSNCLRREHSAGPGAARVRGAPLSFVCGGRRDATTRSRNSGIESEIEGPWTIQVLGNALDDTWNSSPGDTHRRTARLSPSGP